MSGSTAGAVPRRRSTASRARTYLAGAALLSLAVAFAVFSAAWSQYAIGQRTTDLARQVVAIAKGQAASAKLDGPAVGATRDRLLRVEAGLIGAALLVTDDGGVVERSTAGSVTAPLPLERLDSVRSVRGVRAGRLRTGDGVPVLMVAAPMGGMHQLVAIQGLAEIRRAQTGLIVIALVALLIASAVAYVAGGVLARRLTAPIVRLESAADHVAAGELGTQVLEDGDAETASLARSFNAMSARVASSYAAQKAFTGDVSHEIRTPLTSIRGYAEAMLDGVITDPDRQRAALTVIRDETIRIAEMSSMLLTLAELEAGSVRIARVPVDIVILGDALLGRFESVAREAGVELAVVLGGERPLGDADRLLQIVSALVANAIAHTPATGSVRVSSEVAGGRWQLSVDDSGPGILAEDRDRIFGRFARLDASRSKAHGGAGLGLSIARRLAELMGGMISVSDSDLGGARFLVSLEADEGMTSR